MFKKQCRCQPTYPLSVIVQDSVEDVKSKVISGVLYNLTLRVHTTACPEGSPDAEDRAACRATHTQRCDVHVLELLWSDGGGHEIVDPQPSCTAKEALPGKMISIFLVSVLMLKSDYVHVLTESGN